jgi:hypothetical protein
LTSIAVVLLLLAVWITIEAIIALLRPRTALTAPA